MANSENNTKYVDLLDEDKPIAGQKFVCVSFISPDKILKQKEMFFFERFLKHFDFSKSMLKFQQFLNFVSYKYNINFDEVTEDYKEFIKTERENLVDTSIEDDYKNFMDNKEDDLTKEFNNLHNFQTNVRGLKVRGSFETQQEAELRCRMLREVDPNHDIFVGPVGMWMPWEPEAYKTGRVEYLEKELNDLMNHKVQNEMQAKQEFEARVKETKQKAIEENIQKAKETGNKLTQNIDEHGNLVGVEGASTVENTLISNETTTSADIKRELFEGDNIVTKKKD
jgi:hypothetical protein